MVCLRNMGSGGRRHSAQLTLHTVHTAQCIVESVAVDTTQCTLTASHTQCTVDTAHRAPPGGHEGNTAFTPSYSDDCDDDDDDCDDDDDYDDDYDDDDEKEEEENVMLLCTF